MRTTGFWPRKDESCTCDERSAVTRLKSGAISPTRTDPWRACSQSVSNGSTKNASGGILAITWSKTMGGWHITAKSESERTNHNASAAAPNLRHLFIQTRPDRLGIGGWNNDSGGGQVRASIY